MPALAITDHDALYGAVKFHQAAKAHGIKPIYGTEITMSDDTHLVLLARDDEGWRNVCRILTRAHLHSPLHAPRCTKEVIYEHRQGLFVLTGCRRGPVYRALISEGTEAARSVALELRSLFGREQLFIELEHPLDRFEEVHENLQLAEIAECLGLRTVATNDVHHALPDDFNVHDVLTCIRLIQKVAIPHPERKLNAERYLKSAEEMAELFAGFPEALGNTDFIARECSFSLDVEGWRVPRFETPTGANAMELLRELSTAGLRRRLEEKPGSCDLHSLPAAEPHCSAGTLAPIAPGGVWDVYISRLNEELALIEEMGFDHYFLLCHDIVREARSRGIRTTGRGSAGNSLVAFALDIVAPDPVEHGMIFQRFMNRERHELPDVDIDFCSRRRDEILEYVYRRYGEDRVAAVATVCTFQVRSAIREVAKALGYSPEEIDLIAHVFPFLSSKALSESFESTPETSLSNLDPNALAQVVQIAERIIGYPHYIGVHVGGIVIADRPLTDYIPLQQSVKGIVICQFDKDDVEALGLVKLDLLGLRMHSAVEHCLDEVERTSGVRPDIDNIPLNDEATYALMQEARTVGCFQLESPGERSLQARLLPRNFRDVIANISLFRPGPVQADMVSPFIERRHGREPVAYAYPSLEAILGETYGVIVYQEQVLQVAHAIAGFSLAEADALRRAMTHDIPRSEFEKLEARFVEGARANGIAFEIAKSIFSQISGFAAYGFCKGHAACFGLIAYQTAYLKAHYPAAFLAGVLSNEPMGYYSSRTIVEEAKRCGIPVLPLDVNASDVRYTVEPLGPQVLAIRIGLMQVRALPEGDQEAIALESRRRPFASLFDFCYRLRVGRVGLENLILAGAFDSLPVFAEEPEPEFLELPSGTLSVHVPAVVRADALRHRRRLLWMLPSILRAAGSDEGPQMAMPLFDADLSLQEARARKSLSELMDDEPENRSGLERGLILTDYSLLGLSRFRHPLALVRDELTRMGALRTLDLLEVRTGKRVKVGGIVVSRNRPPTRSGRTVVFVTLEDEVGLLDAVVFEDTYYRWRNVIFANDALIVEGRLERPGGTTVSLIVDRASPLKPFAEHHCRGPLLQPGPGDHSHARVIPAEPNCDPLPAVAYRY